MQMIWVLSLELWSEFLNTVPSIDLTEDHSDFLIVNVPRINSCYSLFWALVDFLNYI